MDILSRRNMIYAGENSLPHLILLSFVACAKSLKIIQMNWRNAWKMLPELQSKRSAKLVAPSSGIAKSWKGRGRRRHNNHTEPLTDVVPSSFGCRWWMLDVVCRDDGDEALLLTSTKIQLSQITILKQESDSRPGGKRMPPATRALHRDLQLSWSWVVKRLKLAMTLLGIWLANGPICRWCCCCCCGRCLLNLPLLSSSLTSLTRWHAWPPIWQLEIQAIPIPIPIFAAFSRVASSISSPFIIRC